MKISNIDVKINSLFPSYDKNKLIKNVRPHFKDVKARIIIFKVTA